AILYGSKDEVRDFLLALIDVEVEQIGARSVWTQLNPERGADVVMLCPHLQPIFEELGRQFRLDEVLELRRALAHRLGRRGAARAGHEPAIEPRPADV